MSRCVQPIEVPMFPHDPKPPSFRRVEQCERERENKGHICAEFTEPSPIQASRTSSQELGDLHMHLRTTAPCLRGDKQKIMRNAPPQQGAAALRTSPPASCSNHLSCKQDREINFEAQTLALTSTAQNSASISHEGASGVSPDKSRENCV